MFTRNLSCRASIPNLLFRSLDRCTSANSNLSHFARNCKRQSRVFFHQSTYDFQWTNRYKYGTLFTRKYAL